ncbi:hypothetical protein [Endozoicomonas euniceicola]|uniref:Uncharacterized protein n=1 Tax=Endozoicomonas euniceicola TaxID=1234143 RepID=A0ABY6GSX0_9GAMM|nr:hypothetical protein [Endozoicomonas euniceicola]UYM15094.1 hypothetical protein NX720_19815 [Endozoicomonas euniceicola]
MDAIRSDQAVNYRLSGAATPPSTAETSKEREPERQNPELSVVQDVTPTAGIKRHFAVTFGRTQPNTNRLAQLMESLNSSLAQTKLPVREKQVILQFLNLINDTINSLQIAETPELALTKTFAKKVIEDVIKNPNIPEHLQKSVDLLFSYFRVCKFFDYFMYGSVDQKLCRDLANFLSTIPEKEPLEVMAGAGWLQKGLKDQGVQTRSTDSFKLLESDLYIDQALAHELSITTGMKEHVKDFEVIEGASIEKMDALAALEASSSRVVIICWPDFRCEDLIYEILEHCHKNQKMIIHIAKKDENLSNLLIRAKRPAERNSFIPVKDAPSSHAHLEKLSIGFWKQVPEWFKALKKTAEKDPRPDFRIRHFEP